VVGGGGGGGGGVKLVKFVKRKGIFMCFSLRCLRNIRHHVPFRSFKYNRIIFINENYFIAPGSNTLSVGCTFQSVCFITNSNTRKVLTLFIVFCISLLSLILHHTPLLSVHILILVHVSFHSHSFSL